MDKTTHPAQSPLGDFRVLNLARGRALYLGKLLADLGAEVIKIEETGGDPARRLGPFRGDIPGENTSLYFIYYHTNQKSISLNLQTGDGQEIFRRLIKRADVVIHDFPPGAVAKLRLGYEHLRAINPALIVTSVTGFGQDGPYGDYKCPDMVSFAMGGLMFMSGDPGKAPVVAPCEQACQSASVFASFGTLTALYHRMITGTGQLVEVTAQESMAVQEHLIVRYGLESDIVRRRGSQHTTAPSRLYRCKDGYVYLFVFTLKHWKGLLDLMGNPDVLLSEAWDDVRFRRLNVDVLDPIVAEFTVRHGKAELAAKCQAKHIPCTPVNSPGEFVTDPHIQARGFIVEAQHPVIGKHQYLGPPYKLSESPCREYRAAPALGQHNEDIYCQELGYSKEALARFKADSVI